MYLASEKPVKYPHDIQLINVSFFFPPFFSKERFIGPEGLAREDGRTNSQIHLKRIWKLGIFYRQGGARQGTGT